MKKSITIKNIKINFDDLLNLKDQLNDIIQNWEDEQYNNNKEQLEDDLINLDFEVIEKLRKV